MPTLNDLQAKIDQLNNEVSFIVLAISEKIKEFPDNPNITRIGSQNAFTINFSSLNRNRSLSPRDYDYKFQYEAIARYLIDNPSKEGIERIKDVISKGYFHLKENELITTSWAANRVTLGNEVIQNLKSIL